MTLKEYDEALRHAWVLEVSARNLLEESKRIEAKAEKDAGIECHDREPGFACFTIDGLPGYYNTPRDAVAAKERAVTRQPYQRCKPVRDDEGRRQWAVSQRQRCQVCLGRFDWRGWHCHHIIRFKRSDEPANWLLVCAVCHDKVHDAPNGQPLTVGHTLTCKQLAAPDEFDLARLEQLAGHPLECEPLPDWLLAVRGKGRK